MSRPTRDQVLDAVMTLLREAAADRAAEGPGLTVFAHKSGDGPVVVIDVAGKSGLLQWARGKGDASPFVPFHAEKEWVH